MMCTLNKRSLQPSFGPSYSVQTRTRLFLVNPRDGTEIGTV
jgi:hypothetical protein